MSNINSFEIYRKERCLASVNSGNHTVYYATIVCLNLFWDMACLNSRYMMGKTSIAKYIKKFFSIEVKVIPLRKKSTFPSGSEKRIIFCIHIMHKMYFYFHIHVWIQTLTIFSLNENLQPYYVFRIRSWKKMSTNSYI